MTSSQDPSSLAVRFSCMRNKTEVWGRRIWRHEDYIWFPNAFSWKWLSFNKIISAICTYIKETWQRREEKDIEPAEFWSSFPNVSLLTEVTFTQLDDLCHCLLYHHHPDNQTEKAGQRRRRCETSWRLVRFPTQPPYSWKWLSSQLALLLKSL